MKKIRDAGPVADFIGACIGIASKVIDNLDLFEKDGVLNSIPWGKVISWVVKKAATITDPDEAFRKLFSLAYFYTYREGMHFIYEEWPDFTKEDIQELKGILSDKKYTAGDFSDIDLFRDSEIRNRCDNYYRKFLKNKDSEQNKPEIFHYVDDYLQVNFIYLLEKLKTTFSRYRKTISSEFFQKLKKKAKIVSYMTRTRDLFTRSVNGKEPDVSLSEIYIDPAFEIHKSCFTRNQVDGYTTELIKFHTFIKPDSLGSLTNFVSQILENREPIKLKYFSHNVIVLFGNPGQGKSAFCKKMLYEKNVNFYEHKKFFYLPLIRFEYTDNFILNPFGQILARLRKETLCDDFSFMDLYDSVLLLDGFDEIKFRGDGWQEKAGDFLENLLSLCDDYKFKIIITSRFGFLDPEKRPDLEILSLRIKDFDAEQQKDWISRYKRAHPRLSINPESCEDRDPIVELIANPMLLYFIAKEGFDSLSASEDYYEAIIKSLHNRFYEDQSVRCYAFFKRSGMNENDLKKTLCMIANEIYFSGDDDRMKKTELLEFQKETPCYQKSGANHEFPVFSFFFFRNEQEEGISYLRFKYESFYHYLVAEYLWNELKGNLLERKGSIFVIEGKNSVLSLFFKLFSKRLLHKNIAEFIISFIEKESEGTLQSLSGRFGDLVEYFFEKGFLFEYSSKKNDVLHPFDLSINMFYAFLVLYSHFDRFRESSIFSRNGSAVHFYDLLNLLLSSDNMDKVTFRKANLCGIRFSGLRLQDIDFQDALLIGCDFSSAELDSINLSGSNLSRAVFKSTVLNNVDYNNARFEYASLIDLMINTDELSGVNFESAYLFKIRFEGKEFHDCSFEKSEFSGCDFNSLKLTNINFKEAKFKNGKFEDLEFNNVDFSGARFREMDFYNITFSNDTKFENVKWLNVSMDMAMFSNIRKRYPDMSGKEIEGRIHILKK